MTTNHTHPGESQRLATLAKLQTIEQPDETALERVVQTAAIVFGAPMCAVSLVGEDEEWFKARCGIDAASGPRSAAFCAHTILSDEVLVVENALTDDRFKDNPQVTGDNAIRFYAGAPIIATDGSRIGAFCIKDRKPRQFSTREVEILRGFAAIAMSEILHQLAIKASFAAKRAKSCFLAGVNHAVRSPLTSIFGYTELLVEPGLSEAERQEAVQSIRRNGDQLLEFIDDAILLAELESGGVQSRPRDFVLCDLVRDIEANVGSIARTKNLQLDISTMIDVPPILHADPVLLRHTLAQLLGNSIKYTTSGSVSLHIRNGHKPDSVCFEVSDTGCGMNAEQLANLWTALEFREAKSSRNFGIGLPIVARLAALMHGDIAVRSTPGIGSIFTLHVKARAVDRAASISTAA